MSESGTAATSAVYRVDKFAVPAAGRDEFLGRVRTTHDLLRRQPGFVRDLVLENHARPGSVDIVTLVEWESEAAIAPVVEAVARLHREIGFDRQEMLTRLGIRADLGTYRGVAS